MSQPQIASQPVAQLHRVPAVVDRTRLSRSKVYQFMASGELRSIKVGRRRLVSEAALTEFINWLEVRSALEGKGDN